MVLYSLALENKFFSFPYLQIITQVAVPIFILSKRMDSFLWGQAGERKAEPTVLL